MEIYELVNGIGSRSDLIAFIRALRADLDKNPDTWQNASLEDYLEAMQGWIADIKGWERNSGMDIG
jgi:hypothetical protein